MIKILVMNSRKVSDFLGCNVEFIEDWCERVESKSFVEEYKEYFSTTDKEKLKEFYDKTGLVLMVDYYDRKVHNLFHFTMYGEVNEFPFKGKIYNCHLNSVNYVDNLYGKDDKIYIEDKVIYEYNEEEIKQKKEDYIADCSIRSDMEHAENIYDKLYILKSRKENYSIGIDLDKVKDIFLSILGEEYILLNDGTLLKDKKEYEKNVEEIWSLDSYTTFVIFKDKRIEYLTQKFFAKDIKADNIIYTNYFIAILKDKVLDLYIKQDYSDTSIFETFSNVDKVVYDTCKEELQMYVNGNYITLDTKFASIISD